MAIDAVCLTAIVAELGPQLTGLRVDKVQQPARDQVVLLFRGKRLLLCAGAGAPRLQLTEIPRDNPAEPPMFCMLLRKHLSGARLAGLSQPPLERLVKLEFDASDELGRAGKRTLVLEAMGRRSNLILLDGEDRILDSLRRVDADMSAARQVLPGRPLRLGGGGEDPGRLFAGPVFRPLPPHGQRAELPGGEGRGRKGLPA